MLIDLSDPRFSNMAVHQGLEEVDRLGVVPVRDHYAPESILGWTDAVFGGFASSEVATGGVWVFKRDDRPIGLSSYDVRGVPLHWLRAWTARDGVATLGPFGFAERLTSTDDRALERVLLHATLASVAERGYRRALVPAVESDERIGFYEREANARVVESVDPERGGRRFRATILASGNGSNFEAVARAAQAGSLPITVERLIVNRPSAFALERAARLGVASEVVAWNRATESRDAFDARVIEAVASTEPDVVLLLGWMHVLPETFVGRFPELLNLHPAFLPLDPSLDRTTMPDGTSIPALRGAHTVDDAIAAGLSWFGASVHRVGVAVDRGRVLARIPLQLDAEAGREAIDGRLHDAEARALSIAIRRWAYEMP